MAWVGQGTLDEVVCLCRDILKWKERISASHQGGALDEKVAFVCLCTDFAAVTIALRLALVTHRNDQVKHAIIAHLRLMDHMCTRFRAPTQFPQPLASGRAADRAAASGRAADGQHSRQSQ